MLQVGLRRYLLTASLSVFVLGLSASAFAQDAKPSSSCSGHSFILRSANWSGGRSIEAPDQRKAKEGKRQSPEAGAQQNLQEVAGRRRRLHYLRRRTQSLQTAFQRRRARPVHRSLLAAPRSHARYRRKRIQRRALPPHRICQRTLRRRNPWLEKRPRPHLHHVRTRRRD